MKRQEKLIGMIGGLGPVATIHYYSRMVRMCRMLCGHAPRTLIYTIPVEEMCKAVKEGRVDRVSHLLTEALDSLASGGARVVFIAANTPHVAWESFREKAEERGLTPVSIIEASVDEVVARGYQRVAVIASKPLYESRLYQEALESRGVKVVELPEALVSEADELIQRLASGEVGEGEKREAISLLEKVAGLGVDAAILACTELPAVLEGVETPLPVVDTVEAQLRRVFELATRA